MRRHPDENSAGLGNQWSPSMSEDKSTVEVWSLKIVSSWLLCCKICLNVTYETRKVLQKFSGARYLYPNARLAAARGEP